MKKIYKILKILLILGSVLAAIKVIFVDYTMDEEYQVVMAYRNLSGDTLFGTMWEPHQTSAFLCLWLMRLFVALTGTTTGVVIFLRVCTTVIQLLLSLWLCRVLGRFMEKEYAFLLGLCYFNIVPKIIQIPEFGNLQVWFYTVIILAVICYYKDYSQMDANKLQGRSGWLAAAGLGMALEVLSYPSMLLLFPFFMAVIFIKSRKSANSTVRGLRDCLIFAGVCGISAAVWLWRVLDKVSVEEFLRNVGYVLNFDLTHDISLTAESKIITLVRGLRTLIIAMSAVLVIAFALWCGIRRIYGRKKTDAHRPGRVAFAICMIMASEVVQLFYWIVLRRGYEEPLIHILVMILAAALVWTKADGRRQIAAAGICGSVLSILAVIYMSDLDAWYAIPHGMPGALLGAAVLIFALESQFGERGKVWIYLLLFSLAFVSVFGKGFTLRAGTTETNTVLGIRGIIRNGPAAGIFTNYMQAYITNSTYEEFEEYVEPGSNCLIVTNMVGTAGTSPYLFNDSKVCHFSIVDPTSYDERLMTYWELYPEKEPELIVVDCWFGVLKESEDSWIMQYIENDFGYKNVVDGNYLRYYFK